MEEWPLKQPALVGRTSEMQALERALEDAGQSSGSTLFVSGEAGIGKTRLVSELIQKARDEDALIISGWCLPECLEPLMPVKEALREGELYSLIAETPPPRLLSTYLLNDAGILYAKAEREESGMDADIFASMLKAVSSFAIDSLKMIGEGGSGALNTIGYSNYKIIVQSSGGLSLAAVIEGRESELLINDMNKILKDLSRDARPDMMDMSGSGWMADRISGLIKSGKYEGTFVVDDPRLKQENMFDNLLLGLQRLAEGRLVVFFLDDLQWSDPTTLNLMHYLARNTRGHGIMLLATYRPEDILKSQGDSPHPLETTMQNMSRESLFKDIRLKRLGSHDTVSFVEELLGVPELPGELGSRIFKESEGNPFFTLELVRLIMAEGYLIRQNGSWAMTRDYDELMLPNRIFDIVQRRLNRLEGRQYEILECASVVGENFTSDIVGHSLGLNRISLLKDLGNIQKDHMLIHSQGRRYHFDHSKIRDVLYASINDELRDEYHKMTAESYARVFQGREDEVVEEMAHHYHHANDSRATGLLLKAGDRAKARYANDEAIHFYNLAMGHDPGLRYELLMKNGELHTIIGNCQEALSCFDEALELAGDVQERAWAYRRMSTTFERHSEYENGIEAAHKALSLLGEGMEPLKLEILGSLAWNHIRQGDYDGTEKILEECLALATEIDNRKELSVPHHLMGTISWFRGRLDAALEHYEEAVKIQRETGDDRGKENTLNNIGVIYMEIGRLDEALKYFEEGLEYEEMVGDKNGMAGTIDNIGNIYHTKGQVEKSLELHSRALDLYRMAGDRNGVAWSLSSLGYVYPDLGDVDKGIQCYLESIEICKDIGDKHILVYNYYGVAEACVRNRDFDKALHYVDLALELARELGAVREEGAALYVQATAYRDMERFSDAMEAFSRARDMLEEIGDTSLLAMMDLDEAMCLKLQGEEEKAVPQMQRALASFRKMGMQLWVEKAEKALADTGQ